MRILITGGPTREPIDDVRFIGNRSSGRMSLALARTAAEAGHQTTLLLGPIGHDETELAFLHRQGVCLYRFESSKQLQTLLESYWPEHDVLIMAAAVADFRPRTMARGKLPRNQRPMKIDLEPTPDLVAAMAAMRRPNQKIVAFALEQAQGLEERARDKLRRKGVDAIVANPLAAIDHDLITPLWLAATGDRKALGQMTKVDFSRWLVRWLGEEGQTAALS